MYAIQMHCCLCTACQGQTTNMALRGMQQTSLNHRRETVPLRWFKVFVAWHKMPYLVYFLQNFQVFVFDLDLDPDLDHKCWTQSFGSVVIKKEKLSHSLGKHFSNKSHLCYLTPEPCSKHCAVNSFTAHPWTNQNPYFLRSRGADQSDNEDQIPDKNQQTFLLL